MLTSAPLAPRETERRAQELLNEFLKSYFNGLPHPSPLGDVTFPACKLFFNQASIQDPVEPQIHVVFTDFRPPVERWDAGRKLVTAPALISFYFRTANQGGGNNALKGEQLCRQIAANALELFQSELRYDLAQKGMRYLRVARGPTPLQSIGYQVRLMVVSAIFRYFVPRTESTGSITGGSSSGPGAFSFDSVAHTFDQTTWTFD